MAWVTTWNAAWKTSLASALTSYTVKVGPLASIEADDNAAAVIITTTDREWRPAMSPSGKQVYDVRVYLGVVVHGMDDPDSVDDVWDVLDTVEAAAWTLLAPGAFRASQKIDEVVSIQAGLAAARSGSVIITLRVRRD